jgi:hypothetical protein
MIRRLGKRDWENILRIDSGKTACRFRVATTISKLSWLGLISRYLSPFARFKDRQRNSIFIVDSLGGLAGMERPLNPSGA